MGSYDHRIQLDGRFGYLNGSVDALATQLTSTAFASLPVITPASVDDYIPITLADDTIPALETVWITGHSDGSPTVAVVRGREGTAGKQWTTGATWRLAATARDLVMALPSRAALPIDAHLGARASLMDEGVEITRRPAGWTGAARYGWKRTEAPVSSGQGGTVQNLAALAGNPSPGVATLASNVLKLNKPGFWALLLHVYAYSINFNGWCSAGLNWPGGAWSHMFPLLQDKRSTLFTANDSSTNLTVEWTGWVTQAQADAGISPVISQANGGPVSRSFDIFLGAEQLW